MVCATLWVLDSCINWGNSFHSKKTHCTTPTLTNIPLGCVVFTTFFIRFEVNLSEYRSYSLHIQNIRTDSQTNIRFDAKNVVANVRFTANICFRFFHAGQYVFQNIGLEVNIHKTLSRFHIQANICLQIFAYKWIFACKYSHTKEYLLHIASNYWGQPFTSLRPQLVFGSFWKYLLRKEYSLLYLVISHLKFADFKILRSTLHSTFPQLYQNTMVHCYFVNDRYVPEWKVSDVTSLGKSFP